MAIQRTTLKKRPVEVILYLFNFTPFPELKAGETLSSPVVPAVTGLAIGTPAVTTVTRDGIAAGKAIECVISGGTAGVTYEVECYADTSGGSRRSVIGRIVVG